MKNVPLFTQHLTAVVKQLFYPLLSRISTTNFFFIKSCYNGFLNISQDNVPVEFVLTEEDAKTTRHRCVCVPVDLVASAVRTVRKKLTVEFTLSFATLSVRYFVECCFPWANLTGYVICFKVSSAVFGFKGFLTFCILTLLGLVYSDICRSLRGDFSARFGYKTILLEKSKFRNNKVPLW